VVGLPRPKGVICVDDFLIPAPRGMLMHAGHLDDEGQRAAFDYAMDGALPAPPLVPGGPDPTLLIAAPQSLANRLILRWALQQPESQRRNTVIDITKLGVAVTEVVAASFANRFGLPVGPVPRSAIGELNEALHLHDADTDRVWIKPTVSPGTGTGTAPLGDLPAGTLDPIRDAGGGSDHSGSVPGIGPVAWADATPGTLVDLQKLTAALRAIQQEWTGRLGGVDGEVYDAWVLFGRRLNTIATNIDRTAALAQPTGVQVDHQRTAVAERLLTAYDEFRALLPGDRPKSVEDLLAPPRAKTARLDFAPSGTAAPTAGATAGTSDLAFDYLTMDNAWDRRGYVGGLLTSTAAADVQAVIAELEIAAGGLADVPISLLGDIGADEQRWRELDLAGAVATVIGARSTAAPPQWVVERVVRAASGMSPREALDWIGHLDVVAWQRPEVAAPIGHLIDLLRPVADRATQAATDETLPPGVDVWAPVRRANQLAAADATDGKPAGHSVDRLEAWNTEAERGARNLPAASVAASFTRTVGAITALRGTPTPATALDGASSRVSGADVEAAVGAPFRPLPEGPTSFEWMRAWTFALSEPGASVWFLVPAGNQGGARAFGLVRDDRSGEAELRWVDPVEPGVFAGKADLRDPHGALISTRGVEVLALDGTGAAVDLGAHQHPLAPPAPRPVKQALPRPTHPEHEAVAKMVATSNWSAALAILDGDRTLADPQAVGRAVDHVDHRISRETNTIAIGRLTTVKGLLQLHAAGRTGLARDYLTEADPAKRRMTLTSAVPGADVGTLIGMANLSTALVQRKVEKADIELISAIARILNGAGVSVDRSLVPKFVSYGARVNWYKAISAVATRYPEFKSQLDDLIREVLRC
jgi:hypothetical protein